MASSTRKLHPGCFSRCFCHLPHDICCRWLRSVLHGFCITPCRHSRRTAESQSKKAFSRTSNWNSKKAVRFSLEVGRWRKTPRHQLFSEFFAKAIKMPGQFVYGGGFQVLLSSHKIPQGIGKRWHSKSVCAKAHKGSNPFLSANQNLSRIRKCSD